MTDLFGQVTSTAVLSPCTECPTSDRREACTGRRHRPWRYELRRIWDPTLPLVVWVMLNPSTATADEDDPTIRRCRDFSKSWRSGGFIVVNLFALRATDPRELVHHADPVGPDNDAHLSKVAAEAGLLVCAWGAHKMVGPRVERVLARFGSGGITPRCLGTTKGGHPRHPLYVKASTPLVPYEHAGRNAA